MVTSLYDDPQIHIEDWHKAATQNIRLNDDVWVDEEAAVLISDDFAYVQAWVHVDTEDALDKARDRQAEEFNRQQARLLGRSEN